MNYLQNVPEFNEAIPSSRPTTVDLKVEVKKNDSEHLQLKVCAVLVKLVWKDLLKLPMFHHYLFSESFNFNIEYSNLI